MDKRRLKTKPFIYSIILLLIILAVLIASFVSYAWLFKNVQMNQNIYTTNVILNVNVYFVQSDNSIVQGSLYRDAKTGYYLVNISNSSAANYATKLRVDISYKGITQSYLRVLVDDMWLDGNGKAIMKQDTNYSVSSSTWLDNRDYDSWYYYIADNGKGRGVILNGTDSTTQTIPLITGIQNFAPISGGQVYLEIRADSVQINRINAFWNMTSIPS